MFELSAWDSPVGIVTRVLDERNNLHLHVELLLVLLLDPENGGNNVPPKRHFTFSGVHDILFYITEVFKLVYIYNVIPSCFSYFRAAFCVRKCIRVL
jgi:hypothetical protein